MKKEKASGLKTEKVPAKKWSMTKRAALTINVTDVQREMLRRIATIHGSPGVPVASLAATAFTRGLHIIQTETGMPCLLPNEIEP